jgi:7,8-didemethyl-8-hydroxy-5-deazariboflavin synthase CofG subunit
MNLEASAAPAEITYSPSWTLIPTHYCRNTCGYCVFVKRTGAAAELLTINRARAIIDEAHRRGASELLIMSGEGVETSRDARKALRQMNFNSYIDYLIEIARLALERDLLPHINIGNLTDKEFRALRAVVPSMGMMLETIDRTLRKTVAHGRAPDKEPAQRIETLRAAGRARVPFTTGLLVGIGESARTRKATLRTIADVQRAYGHIQEVIIQPFTPHAGTIMSACAPPTLADLCATVEMARAILPPEVAVQIPPNIAPQIIALIQAGARDLGGISPDGDRINPTKRWHGPQTYAAELAAHGYTLRARLAMHDHLIDRAWLSQETLSAVARGRERLPKFSGKVVAACKSGIEERATYDGN